MTRILRAGGLVSCVIAASFGQSWAGERPDEAAQAQKVPPDDLDAVLRRLTGTNAIFCGHVGLRQGSRTANKCARKAFSEEVSFYVVYDTGQKIDTSESYSTALARDSSGRMYEVSFAGAGFRYVWPGGQLDASSRIVTTPCPTPYHLREGMNGGVTHGNWRRPRAKRLSCRQFWK